MGFLRVLPLALCLNLSLVPAEKPPPSGPRPALPYPVAYSPDPSVLMQTGQVEAIAELPLSVPTSGWVRQIFFAEGEYVQRRQILLRYYHRGPYGTGLDRRYLLVPRAGFVVQKNAAVGQHLGPGTWVALLQDVSQVKVVVAVQPPPGQQLQLCDAVPVRIAELPTRRFTGLIDHIRPPSPTRPTLLLTVSVRNHLPPLIRPGMRARVWLPTRPLPPVVARR